MKVSQVEKLFSEWRASRKYTRQKIPTELWKEAAKLAELEGLTTTAKRLGVNTKRLSSFMINHETPSSNECSEFVRISKAPEKKSFKSVDSHDVVAEIQVGNGISIRLFGEINSQNFEALGSLISEVRK